MESHGNKKIRLGNIVHNLPGRIRIKIKDDQVGSSFYANIKEAISAIPGVNSVRINKHSSSIIVNYLISMRNFHTRLQEDPKVTNWLSLDVGDIEDPLCNDSRYSNFNYPEQHSRIAETLVSVAEELDAELLQVSNGYLDFKVLLPLGIAIATSMSRARGRGTPMWISLSTFAFNSFLTFHHRRINTPMVHIFKNKTKRM